MVVPLSTRILRNNLDIVSVTEFVYAHKCLYNYGILVLSDHGDGLVNLSLMLLRCRVLAKSKV